MSEKSGGVLKQILKKKTHGHLCCLTCSSSLNSIERQSGQISYTKSCLRKNTWCNRARKNLTKGMAGNAQSTSPCPACACFVGVANLLVLAANKSALEKCCAAGSVAALVIGLTLANGEELVKSSTPCLCSRSCGK